MKKTITMLALLSSTGMLNAQSVGIGTTTPGSSAVLDVTSTNKGILLPRVADTGAVAGPTAGLMIYNRKTNAVAYHDGTKWQSLLRTSDVPTDSVTYTIATTSGGFVAGTFNASAFNHSGVANGSSLPDMAVVAFSKGFDANSIPFRKFLTGGLSGNPVIEFKAYMPGSSTPYYSIKMTTIRIASLSGSASTNGRLEESYTLTCSIIGFKDWVNNQSFSYTVNNGAVGAY